jgi:molecular chaperone DnaK
MVERRADEDFEKCKQSVETISAELLKLLPQVEQMVGQSEFGRDAVARARTLLTRTDKAIAEHDLQVLKNEVPALERTQRMFRGVVSRT